MPNERLHAILMAEELIDTMLSDEVIKTRPTDLKEKQKETPWS